MKGIYDRIAEMVGDLDLAIIDALPYAKMNVAEGVVTPAVKNKFADIYHKSFETLNELSGYLDIFPNDKRMGLEWFYVSSIVDGFIKINERKKII